MRIAISKKLLLVISLVSVPVIVSAGMYFQPWKLFTDTRVEEGLPQLTKTNVAPKEATSDKGNEKVVEKEEPLSGGNSATDSTEVIDSPEVIAEGKFISHEHATTGSLKIHKYSDGSRM